MTKRTIEKVFGYTDSVLRRKPARKEGQELRDYPTYSIPEAAAYLATSPHTLRSWYTSASLLSASAKIKGVHLLSFQDLTEAFFLRTLRHSFGYSMRKIQAIVANVKAELNVDRPLLSDRVWMLLGRLILEKPGRGRRPVLMIDMLTPGGQMALPELVRSAGSRIVRDSKGAPLQIFPWRLFSPGEESRPVSISPDVMSGKLVVTGTRIPVQTIVAMKASGRSAADIARVYRLDLDRVQKAIQHFERPIHKKTA